MELLKNTSYRSHQISYDDGHLVIKCQQGDEHAQELLYNKYADKMYNVCKGYVNEEMLAEDTMTEGFVKIFAKIHLFEYRGKGSLDAWIKRIMINESLMALRKRKMDFVDVEKARNGSIQKETADGRMMEQDILSVVEALPKGYRTVFSMYAIDGYNHKEIGKRLGISENTSKSQYSKARASLSKSMYRLGLAQ